MLERTSYFLYELKEEGVRDMLSQMGFDTSKSGYIYPHQLPKEYPRHSLKLPINSSCEELLREKMDPLPLAYLKGNEITLLNGDHKMLQNYHSVLTRKIHDLKTPESAA